MIKEYVLVDNIPAIVWGEKSDRAYIFVHGKLSNKELAADFARKAVGKGYQVLSFDLPEHGERKDENYSCNIFNAVNDLLCIGRFAGENWNKLSLYANSLGAYFSLMAFGGIKLEKCLFTSPVVDMKRFIEDMMMWAGTNSSELEEKGEIPTVFGETLSWDYYLYVCEHQTESWTVPTSILYGSEDNLTSYETISDFAKKFDCELTVLKDGKHYFGTSEELAELDVWLDENI